MAFPSANCKLFYCVLIVALALHGSHVVLVQGACVASGATCNSVISGGITAYAPSLACITACLNTAPNNLIPTCCATATGSPTAPCSCCALPTDTC